MGKLTFEHFCDRPTWAAAAGYEFNIIDCLSYSAKKANMSVIKDVLRGIPDIELRSLLWELPLSLLAIAVIVTWPVTFWAVGLFVYIRCRKNRKKYFGSENERVQINLRNWLNEFERRQRRAAQEKAQ